VGSREKLAESHYHKVFVGRSPSRLMADRRALGRMDDRRGSILSVAEKGRWRKVKGVVAKLAKSSSHRASITSVLAKHKTTKDAARQLLARTQPGKRTPRMLDEIAAHCSSLKFFRRFPPEQCRRILDAVRCVTLGPGGTVFEQGDAGLLFYVVLHGACELFVQEEKAASRAAGTPTLTSSLFLLYAGDSFGELSLIEEGADGAWRPGDRSGTVQATDGGVELLTLSQPEYMALVGTRY